MDYLEMLARLGVGSAHPGGFAATLEQLVQFPIPPGSRVLEVGCGTGLTACHLASLGYDVTAVDLRDDMLDKARLRAHREGCSVHFVRGNALDLPFLDAEFDVVLVESVTNFTEATMALREYRRVLREGGSLYDREIVALKPIDIKVRQAMFELYGFDRLYAPEEWQRLLEAAGYDDVMLWNVGLFRQAEVQGSSGYPDLTLADPDAIFREDVWETANRHERLNHLYGDQFGYAVMIGRV
jgi:SAM-dependent methyltransferase